MFHPPIENNKLFKPNKPRGQRSFREVKILGWFTIIGYTPQNTFQDHAFYQPHFLKGGYLVGPYMVLT